MTASPQRKFVSTPSTCWRLEGLHARLDAGGLLGEVDVAAPARGLGKLTVRDVAVAGWLLGIGVEAESNDAYVRGNDLVVTYRETAERPFSVQIYWRVGAVRHDEALVLDATVSIQTRQWEAYPRVTATSSLAHSECIAFDDSAILFRPADRPWSYAEFSRSGDFILQPAADRDGSAWQFGEQFMERGVIRRLFLRGALVPRANDQAALERLRTALAAEQPPLTA